MKSKDALLADVDKLIARYGIISILVALALTFRRLAKENRYRRATFTKTATTLGDVASGIGGRTLREEPTIYGDKVLTPADLA